MTIRVLAGLVGVLVLVFGAWRIRLGLRGPEEDAEARRRGGLVGRGKLAHLVYGTIYVLMGVVLLLRVAGIDLLPRLW